MFFEEKYDIDEKKQDCTKFVLKVLPQYLEYSERKRFKELVIAIKVLSQMNSDEIPNYEDGENIYRTIIYVEFLVNDIKSTYKYVEILHKLFKAPTILRIIDNKQNYFYSFSLKRLNKLNKNEIVIDWCENTQEFSNIINTLTRECYEIIVNSVKNKNNKYEYYYELLLKTKLFNMKDILKEYYSKLIESNMFYNIEKMKYNFEQLCLYSNLINDYTNNNEIGIKYNIKNQLNNIKFKL